MHYLFSRKWIKQVHVNIFVGKFKRVSWNNTILKSLYVTTSIYSNYRCLVQPRLWKARATQITRSGMLESKIIWTKSDLMLTYTLEKKQLLSLRDSQKFRTADEQSRKKYIAYSSSSSDRYQIARVAAILIELRFTCFPSEILMNVTRYTTLLPPFFPKI